MAKKKVVVDLSERFQLNVRLSVKHYMYLARLAVLSRHGKIQKIIEDLIPTNWSAENDRLTVITKKMGYRDVDFYPPKLLNRLGYPSKRKPGPIGSKIV